MVQAALRGRVANHAGAGWQANVAQAWNEAWRVPWGDSEYGWKEAGQAVQLEPVAMGCVTDASDWVLTFSY